MTARLDENILDLDQYREYTSDFYEYSFQRDHVFIDNLKFPVFGDKTSIIVTGGFHTENLCGLLKENNISYISIMPSFKKAEGYESPYFDLLAGQESGMLKTLSLIISSVSVMQIYTMLGASNVAEEIWGKSNIDAFRAAVVLQTDLARGRKVIVKVEDKSGQINEYVFGDERSEVTVSWSLERLLYEIHERDIDVQWREGYEDLENRHSPEPVEAQEAIKGGVRERVASRIEAIADKVGDVGKVDKLRDVARQVREGARGDKEEREGVNINLVYLDKGVEDLEHAGGRGIHINATKLPEYNKIRGYSEEEIQRHQGLVDLIVHAAIGGVSGDHFVAEAAEKGDIAKAAGLLNSSGEIFATAVWDMAADQRRSIVRDYASVLDVDPAVLDADSAVFSDILSALPESMTASEVLEQIKRLERKEEEAGVELMSKNSNLEALNKELSDVRWKRSKDIDKYGGKARISDKEEEIRRLEMDARHMEFKKSTVARIISKVRRKEDPKIRSAKQELEDLKKLKEEIEIRSNNEIGAAERAIDEAKNKIEQMETQREAMRTAQIILRAVSRVYYFLNKEEQSKFLLEKDQLEYFLSVVSSAFFEWERKCAIIYLILRGKISPGNWPDEWVLERLDKRFIEVVGIVPIFFVLDEFELNDLSMELVEKFEDFFEKAKFADAKRDVPYVLRYLRAHNIDINTVDLSEVFPRILAERNADICMDPDRRGKSLFPHFSQDDFMSNFDLESIKRMSIEEVLDLYGQTDRDYAIHGVELINPKSEEMLRDGKIKPVLQTMMEEGLSPQSDKVSHAEPTLSVHFSINDPAYSYEVGFWTPLGAITQNLPFALPRTGRAGEEPDEVFELTTAGLGNDWPVGGGEAVPLELGILLVPDIYDTDPGELEKNLKSLTDKIKLPEQLKSEMIEQFKKRREALKELQDRGYRIFFYKGAPNVPLGMKGKYGMGSGLEQLLEERAGFLRNKDGSLKEEEFNKIKRYRVGQAFPSEIKMDGKLEYSHFVSVPDELGDIAGAGIINMDGIEAPYNTRGIGIFMKVAPAASAEREATGRAGSLDVGNLEIRDLRDKGGEVYFGGVALPDANMENSWAGWNDLMEQYDRDVIGMAAKQIFKGQPTMINIAISEEQSARIPEVYRSEATGAKSAANKLIFKHNLGNVTVNLFVDTPESRKDLQIMIDAFAQKNGISPGTAATEDCHVWV